MLRVAEGREHARSAFAMRWTRLDSLIFCMLVASACESQSSRHNAAPAIAHRAVQDSSYIDSLHVEIVPLERVIPHEYIDPVRVVDLVKFTEENEVVANPIIVVKSGENYVVMDGATRTAALKSIHASNAIVQVVSESTGFSLGTWYHAIPVFAEDRLVRLLDSLPLLRLEELPAMPPREKQFVSTDIAYVQMRNGRVLVVHPRPGVETLDAMNQFTASYTDAVGEGGHHKVQRTRAETLQEVQKNFGEIPATALVTYPALRQDDITAVVDAGAFVPAGITRSIVNGRLLNLSVPLQWLMDPNTAASNQLLQELIAQKKAAGEFDELEAGYTVCEENGPRPYAEALVVLKPFDYRYFPTGSGDCQPDGIK